VKREREGERREGERERERERGREREREGDYILEHLNLQTTREGIGNVQVLVLGHVDI
jgi:hypothetical protein